MPTIIHSLLILIFAPSNATDSEIKMERVGGFYVIKCTIDSALRYKMSPRVPEEMLIKSRDRNRELVFIVDDRLDLSGILRVPLEELFPADIFWESYRLVDQLQLQKTENVQTVLMFGSQYSRSVQFEIISGKALGKYQQVISSYPQGSVAGVLGYNFMKWNRAVVDYGNNVIKLRCSPFNALDHLDELVPVK